MSKYFYEADWPFACPLYAIIGEYDERMPKEQIKEWYVLISRSFI